MEVMTKSRTSSKKKFYLNCLIVEDDYAFANTTKALAEELGLRVLSIGKSLKEIEEAIREFSFDLIIRSKKLQNQSIIDYLSTKKSVPPQILLSSDDYTNNSAQNIYPVKSLDVPALKGAVENALKDISESMLRNGDIQKNEYNLYVRSSGKLMSLDTNRISHIKAEGNYCIFHTEGKKIVIRSSISNALNTIDQSNFVQIHRGYVVNMDVALKLISSENILRLENHDLPIGRKYKKNLVSIFKNR